MKKMLILFSLLVLLKVSLLQDCKTQKEKIGTDLQSSLQKPFDKDTWWLYKAFSQFTPEQELKSLKVCEKLKQVEVNTMTNMNKFYLYSLNKEANCGMKLDEEMMKYQKSELKSSKLEDFYKAFVLTAQYQSQQNLTDSCLRIPEFFDQTGSGLADKAKTDASYLRSYLLYEMAAICFESKSFTPTEEFKKKLNNAIKAFITNSVRPSYNMIGMFEKSQDVYRTTVGNVLYIYKINKFIQNQQFIDEFNNYMNFIIEGKSIYLKPQEKAFAFQLIYLLKEHPKIELKHNSFELNDKKTIEIKGSIKNFYKEELANTKKMEIQAALYFKFEQKAKLKVKVKMENNSFAIEVPTKDLEVGMYSLQFDINNNEQIIKDEVGIKFTTKVKISNLKLDSGYQNSMPDHLRYKVKFEETLPEILRTDQNGFIYLQFSISSIPDIKPQQVAAKLIHSEYIKATSQVIAKAEEQSQTYSLIIDLGDPDHIQAYKGKYELEIIVADPLLTSNIKWRIATFDIDFKRELTTRPAEDTDYNLKPEISHYFAQPLPDPPKFITMGFIGLLALGICVFLYGVCRLNLNSGKLFNGISVILFIFCIFGYIGILGLFWVKINIFQTLLLFLILLIPTLITGNFALLALTKEQKQKID